MFEKMKRKLISAAYADEEVGDAIRLNDAIKIIEQARAEYYSEKMEMQEIGMMRGYKDECEREEFA